MLRKDNLGRDSVKLHVAARGKEGKAVSHRTLDISPRAAEQRAVPEIEPELAAMGTDEVQHGAQALSGRLSQPTSELLEEQRRALGWPEHEDGLWRVTRISGREIDRFVRSLGPSNDLRSGLAGGQPTDDPLDFAPEPLEPA